MAAYDLLHSLLDYECLLFHCDWLASDFRIGHFYFRCPLVSTPELNTELPYAWRTTAHFLLPWVESYVTTDGQSASLSWNKAPTWDLLPDFYYCQTVAGLLMWGALSDKRTGLSFTIAAGPSRAQSFSGPSPVRLATIFYCLRLKTSLLSPPMTRRATLEVFDPATTRDTVLKQKRKQMQKLTAGN
jgi:hypothetical protein